MIKRIAPKAVAAYDDGYRRAFGNLARPPLPRTFSQALAAVLGWNDGQRARRAALHAEVNAVADALKARP